jgi:hypothetical protein
MKAVRGWCQAMECDGGWRTVGLLARLTWLQGLQTVQPASAARSGITHPGTVEKYVLNTL